MRGAERRLLGSARKHLAWLSQETTQQSDTHQRTPPPPSRRPRPLSAPRWGGGVPAIPPGPSLSPALLRAPRGRPVLLGKLWRGHLPAAVLQPTRPRVLSAEGECKQAERLASCSQRGPLLGPAGKHGMHVVQGATLGTTRTRMRRCWKTEHLASASHWNQWIYLLISIFYLLLQFSKALCCRVVS